jgi:folate-binding protein YgfZ
MIFPQALCLSYSPGTLLRVTGDDAFNFLQGQFTNELRQPPGSATYGLWLNQKGKVLADSQVLRTAEREFLIASEVSSVAVIRSRLEQYIIADDVALADETAATQGLLLGGTQARAIVQELLGAAPARGRFLINNEILVYGGRRLPGESYELLGPGQFVAEIRQRSMARGAIEASVAEVDFARISAGIPSVPVDLGPGDLPDEGGLEDSALSYTKGCYLGQEVMARLKNLGQVRRRLHVVRGRGARPAPSTPLFQDAKKVGELRSVAGQDGEFVAWAMLSLVNLDATRGVSLEPAGPADITVDRHG